jgi:ubiquitin carboxyl-terminal hydrolase 8
METEESTIKYGVSKFKNIMGVTCYMNSILHILQQTPTFIDYILLCKFKDTIMKKIDNIEDLNNMIIVELYRLFQVSLTNDDTDITPTTFRQLIGKRNDMWLENNHQDSQEFTTFLISQLEEEVGTKCTFVPGNMIEMDDEKTLQSCDFISDLHIIMGNNMWTKFQFREYSPLKLMFDGMTQNTRRCSCCHGPTTMYEPYITLGLSIPIKSNHDMDFTKQYSVYDCLDHMVHEEQLDVGNEMNCDMCGLKNRGYSKIQLWRSPKILILNIKRFLVNNFGIPTRKLTNNIIYPITNLDLEKYFDPASPYKSSAKYDLFGVNIHHAFGMGLSINAGHYTSFVKNMINNNWYHYNDSAPVQQITKASDLQNNNAYLLFYYRHD